jgi:hypothetical protein
MYTHPCIGSKLDHDRRRSMRADVGQHRLARQPRDVARASRRAEKTLHRQLPAPTELPVCIRSACRSPLVQVNGKDRWLQDLAEDRQ